MAQHRMLRGARCGSLQLTTHSGLVHLPLRPELVTMVAALINQPKRIVSEYGQRHMRIVRRLPGTWAPSPAPSSQ